MTAHRSWSACSHTLVRAPVVLALAVAGFGTAAQADDRPFLRTTTAVVEDDDERAFEWSASHLNGPKERSTQWQLGYSFSPTLSVEAELGQVRDKTDDLSSREQGLGLWMSWIDPARQGWGLATQLRVERERESGASWEEPQWKGVLAFSVPLAEKTAWLHANVGMRHQSPSNGLRRWASLWSVAAQKELNRRFELFAEWAGTQDRRDQLAQAGVRHWIKREKLAIDIGAGRQFAENRRGHFAVVSLSVLDISP